MTYDRAGLAGASLALAILAYLATCSAHAADSSIAYDAEFFNVADQPSTVVEFCIGESVEHCAETYMLAVSCPSRAYCSARIPLFRGKSTIRARVSTTPNPPAPGAIWGAWSRAVVVHVPTAQECLDDPACRFDSDSDGAVTPADFAAFLGVLGTSRD